MNLLFNYELDHTSSYTVSDYKRNQICIIMNKYFNIEFTLYSISLQLIVGRKDRKINSSVNTVV